MFVIMALVTTFMTTPLVHFVYLRKNQEVVRKSIAAKHPFSVLLNSNNIKMARKMVAASSILSGSEGMRAKILLLKEVSDRPSTYFYSEIYHAMLKETKPLIPGSSEQKERKGVQHELSSYAQTVTK